jgi:Zn-dependent protease/CBS domain-containing protein
MNRHVIPLGRIFGISIGLDFSWFLIFVLLTWTLAVGYFPYEFKDWPTYEYWILGALTAIMLFVSVLLHELGHSVVALNYKIPVTSITLFIFGGMAQIGAEAPNALAEFWIAVAGPAVSFTLAVIFTLLRPLSAGSQQVWAIVTYLAYINFALAIFNLIPGFPLDGGRIFRAIVWGITGSLRKATAIAGGIGRVVGFTFIFLGVWSMFGGNLIGGLWIAFIGWFLENAAAGQVQAQKIEGLLAGHKVSDAMTANYVEIPAQASLQDLIEHYILAGGQRVFVVKDGEAVKGLLTLHRIKEVPRDKWPVTTADQAMIPAGQLQTTRPDVSLWSALKKMDSNGVNQLPVMSDGQMVGMLTREGAIGYLGTLNEIQG